MALDFLNDVTSGNAEDLATALNMTHEEQLANANQTGRDEAALDALRAEIRTNVQSIENVLACADVATGLAAHGVSNKLVGAVFGEHLSACGTPDNVARECAVGLESASEEEVGNEALQTAKQIVMDIVKWLIDQWQKAKALMKRTFAANFGSIKRSGDAFRKVKTRIEKAIEEGYTAEDKAKLDVKSGTDWFVMGDKANLNPRSPEPMANLVKGVEQFDHMCSAITKDLGDITVEIAGGLDEMKGTKASLAGLAHLPTNMAKGVTAQAWNVGTTGVNASGFGLLGRQAFLLQTKVDASTMEGDAIATMTTDQLRKVKKFLNGLSVGIRPSSTKMKPIDEIKLPLATLDELETLVDAHIDLATTALALETDRKVAKLEGEFDKAINAAKKWSKDADSDDAEGKRKAIAASGMMSALLTVCQDATLGLANDLVRHTSALGKAHGSYVSSCLSRYKKA